MKPINNRLLVSLAQRGNTGKSTFSASLAQWLDHHAVPWSGYDLDFDHLSFSRWFPSEVKAMPVGDEPVGDIIKLLRTATDTPVVVVDPRAHMSSLLLDALQVTRFPSGFSEAGGRITAILYPADDLEVMADLDATVCRLGDTVDYLVVRNMARVRHTRMLDGSELEAELRRLGAGFMDLPVLLSLARNHLAAKESELNRGLTPVEAVANNNLGMDPMMRIILEDWLRSVYRRFDAVAPLLLPARYASQIASVDTPPSLSAPAIRGAKLNLKQF